MHGVMAPAWSYERRYPNPMSSAAKWGIGLGAVALGISGIVLVARASARRTDPHPVTSPPHVVPDVTLLWDDAVAVMETDYPGRKKCHHQGSFRGPSNSGEGFLLRYEIYEWLDAPPGAQPYVAAAAWKGPWGQHGRMSPNASLDQIWEWIEKDAQKGYEDWQKANTIEQRGSWADVSGGC